MFYRFILGGKFSTSEKCTDFLLSIHLLLVSLVGVASTPELGLLARHWQGWP
jgi:hypothetical protein